MNKRAIRLIFLSGRSHPKLASEIARQLGTPLGRITLGSFSNGEIRCHIKEELNGRGVIVIQTHHPNPNDQIFEQAVIIRAAKEAGAKSITALCPYFGYSREPQRAKLAADLLLKAGADRILAIDLHEPVDGVNNTSSEPIFTQYIRNLPQKDLVIVSPDTGRVKLALSLSKTLRCGYAEIRKIRQHNSIKMNLIKGEVNHKTCAIVDDIIDSGATICAAADLLNKNGAEQTYPISTH